MAQLATQEPAEAYGDDPAATTHQRGPKFGVIGTGRLAGDAPAEVLVMAACAALAGLRFDGAPFENGTQPSSISIAAIRRETCLGRQVVRQAVHHLQQLGQLDEHLRPDPAAVAERWRTGRRCYFPRGLRSGGVSALAMVIAAGHLFRDGSEFVTRWAGSGRFLEAARLGLPDGQAHKTKRALMALQRAGLIACRRDAGGATLRRLTAKALSVEHVESDRPTVSKADTGAGRKRTLGHVESGHAQMDTQMDKEMDYQPPRRHLAVVQQESGRCAPDNPIPVAVPASGAETVPWVAMQEAEAAALAAIAGGWSTWWPLLQEVHRAVYNAPRDAAGAWNRTLIAAGVHLPPGWYAAPGRRGLAAKRRALAEDCQRIGEPTTCIHWLFEVGKRLQRSGGHPSELGPMLATAVRQKPADYIRRSKARVEAGLGPLPIDCEFALVAQVEKTLPLGQQVVPQTWVEQAQTPGQAATVAAVADLVAAVAAPKHDNQVEQRRQVDHRKAGLLRQLAEPMRRCIAKRDQKSARDIWRGIAKRGLDITAVDLAPYCGTTVEALLLLVAEPAEAAGAATA